MSDRESALKDYFRNHIQDMRREANRLAIQVGLEARDKDDIRTLADTAEWLDTAVESLHRARSQLHARER
jgi:hypothetical protein